MLMHLRLFEALSEVCGVGMVWEGWPRKGKAASCSRSTCGCFRPSQEVCEACLGLMRKCWLEGTGNRSR